MKTIAAILVLLTIICQLACQQKDNEDNEPRTQTPVGNSEKATGRAALNAALDQLYPTSRDYRMGLLPGPTGSEPPIEEVVAYRVTIPVPHWHYITYGLTELDGKVSNDDELSGWGFELTMRVADDGAEPPRWPINFLRWLASTIWRDRDTLGHGHSLLLPNDWLAEHVPSIVAVGFIEDETLADVKSPNGRFEFLQVLPLHGDEYILISRWDAEKMFERIESKNPRFLWNTSHESVLAGDTGKMLRKQADSDGSSQAAEYTAELSWDIETVHLDPLNAVPDGHRSSLSAGLRTTRHYGQWRACLGNQTR